MSEATVTSKGQITVPAAVRQAMGLGTGDRVEFVAVAPGRYEMVAATQPVTALKGLFGPATRSLTIDEMNAVIAAQGRTSGSR